MTHNQSATNSESVRQKVREGYGRIALSDGSCCSSAVSCCGSSAEASEQLVQQIGYGAEELAALSRPLALNVDGSHVGPGEIENVEVAAEGRVPHIDLFDARGKSSESAAARANLSFSPRSAACSATASSRWR